jgi:two-component system, NarL family, response regulator NreC
MAPTRVLICDDHGLVRAGLRRLLDIEADIEVVEEAASADEAVRKARLEKPDVILLDLVMPGRSGLDAVGDIFAAAPAVKILVLSMQDDSSYVRDAFAAGVGGYLLKDAADTDLVIAVREVAAGRSYLHPALGARLASPDTSGTDVSADPLSQREREVLRLLALGYTNQEIAGRLYISVRTAETHRAHIMQKLRLATRADLVHHALRIGVLDANDLPTV